MGWFNAGSKESNSSSSSNTTNTYNTDNRLVADGGSLGLNTSNSNASTVNLNVLDAGAIGALDLTARSGLWDMRLTAGDAINGMSNALAANGIVSVSALDNMAALARQSADTVASAASSMMQTQSAAQTSQFGALVGAMNTLSQNAFHALDSNVMLAGQLNAAGQEAYAGAASQASGTKNIVMAGMVVVGIAAIMAFGKH